MDGGALQHQRMGGNVSGRADAVMGTRDADRYGTFRMLWKRAGMRGIANGARDDCNKSAMGHGSWSGCWTLQQRARVSGATRERVQRERVDRQHDILLRCNFSFYPSVAKF